MYIKRALELVRKIILAALYFVLVLAFMLIFFIIGTLPISQIVRGMYNKCDADLTQEFTLVNLVERQLHLPSKHLHACHPLDMSTSFDYDPASVSLVFVLPDFSVPDYKPESYLEKEDELRIYFTGSRSDINEVDPTIKLGFPDLDERLNFMINIKLNRDGQRIAKYDEGIYTGFNLTFYKTNAVGRNAKDLYVHKDKKGEVNFILECNNKDMKPEPRFFYCSSMSENLYDNVSFKYVFALKNIDDAERIDKIVKEVMNNAIREE